jgi:DNA repair protein RadD
MELSFESIISRADEATLSFLIDAKAVRLIRAVDPSAAVPSGLRRVLLGVRPAEQLLRDPLTRRRLLSQLRQDERPHLLKLVGVAEWEVMLSARSNSKVMDRLLNALKIEWTPRPEAEVVPPTIAIEPEYGLFDHQRRAATESRNLLETGERKVILHMPTGSGKTRTAMSIICSMLQDRKDGLVVWLATSEELCEQAIREFQIAWRFHGNRTIDAHRVWGSHPTPRAVDLTGIAFVGLQRLNAIAKNDAHFARTLGFRTFLHVFDEAHQSVAPTYQEQVRSMIAANPSAALLGLTATPGRTWDLPGEDKRLADFFDGNKVTLQVDGYDSPVTYLIQERYLANPTFRTIKDGSQLGESSVEISKLEANFELPRGVLENLADQDIRNLAIIREIKDLSGRHNRIMVFAATVQHADMIATTLSALGIESRSVSGDTPLLEREAAIAWYKESSQTSRVLTNFGVLTAGFDAPRTSAVLIARPLTSLVLYSQMVGRALRGERVGGNLEAEIVTVVDTSLPGFGKLSDAFNNWEDVWRPTR